MMESDSMLREYLPGWSAAVVLVVLAATVASAQGVVQGSVTAGDTNLPLANAVIELRAIPVAPGGRLRAKTDENGQFQLTGVPPGRYVLTARHAGYSPLTYNPVAGQAIFPVKDGEMPPIRMRMTRQGSVGGLVLGSDGRPLTHARVVLSQRRPVASQNVLLPEREVWTDARGRFSIPGVPAGSYLLSATSRAIPAGSDSTTVYVHTFYPGTTSPRAASYIQVADARSVTGLVLKLSVQPGFPIAGRVATASGSPLGRMRVLARRDTDDGETTFLSADASQATTDEKGAFRIGRLPAGTYRLSVLGAENQQKWVASSTVFLGSSDAAHLTIIAGHGATVKGRILFQGNRRPVSPRAVRLGLQSQRGPGAQGLIHASINDDSTFTIYSIPPGPARFLASLNSESYYVKEILLKGRNVADQAVDFADGDLIREVHVVVALDAAEFSGAVVSHSGTGTPATVVLFPSQPDAWQSSPRLIKVAATTAHGKFVIRGIMPGDYGIVAVRNLDPAAAGDPTLLGALEPFASRVTLRSGGAGSKVLHAIQGPGQR
ncbi:MAG: carboxypeptidase-like regulatory domain-containing protein [Acidobacteria bacterium]|jgi:hypothetical protein|nr:carboxypeptidase-like regulatory domain-containing protein [Acidobacteriota bacterium]